MLLSVVCVIKLKTFHLTRTKEDGVNIRTGNKDWKCNECKKYFSFVSSHKLSASSTVLTKEFLISLVSLRISRKKFSQNLKTTQSN